MSGDAGTPTDPPPFPPPVETVPTCLCGHSGVEAISHARDRLHRLPGEFAFVRCTQCLLVRLSPRPTGEGIAFYYPPEEYYSLADPSASDHRSTLVRRTARLRSVLRDAVLDRMGYPMPGGGAARRLAGRVLRGPLRGSAPYGMGRRFPPFLPGGSALDIGCGNGAFLGHLKRHGWQVTGVDTSPRAAELAKRAFEVDVFVGEAWDSPFPSESFDVIHLSHVIEHVTDPFRLMAKVADLARPGARIYVETPNVDSFGRRRAGDYWVPWEAPRHLYLFSAPTLRELLSRSGLHVERVTTVKFGHLEWEETYRREAREGRALPVRPHVRFGRRPVLAVHSLADLAHRTVRPLSGEILSCWATKAAS